MATTDLRSPHKSDHFFSFESGREAFSFSDILLSRSPGSSGNRNRVFFHQTWSHPVYSRSSLTAPCSRSFLPLPPPSCPSNAREHFPCCSSGDKSNIVRVYEAGRSGFDSLSPRERRYFCGLDGGMLRCRWGMYRRCRYRFESLRWVRMRNWVCSCEVDLVNESPPVFCLICGLGRPSYQDQMCLSIVAAEFPQEGASPENAHAYTLVALVNKRSWGNVLESGW